MIATVQVTSICWTESFFFLRRCRLKGSTEGKQRCPYNVSVVVLPAELWGVGWSCYFTKSFACLSPVARASADFRIGLSYTTHWLVRYSGNSKMPKSFHGKRRFLEMLKWWNLKIRLLKILIADMMSGISSVAGSSYLLLLLLLLKMMLCEFDDIDVVNFLLVDDGVFVQLVSTVDLDGFKCRRSFHRKIVTHRFRVRLNVAFSDHSVFC